MLAVGIPAMFLRDAFLPGFIQHGQQLGGLGTVARGIIPGQASAFNQECGAVQGGVGRFYGNHVLVKAYRPCYNEER